MVHQVHLTWVGFELTTLVVICTDGIGSCKSNYHTITTTTASYVSSIRLVVSSIRLVVSSIRILVSSIRLVVSSHRTTLTTWPPVTTCCLVNYIFIRGLNWWIITIISMKVIFICGGNLDYYRRNRSFKHHWRNLISSKKGYGCTLYKELN
jgi:hypothetical protein